MNLACFHENQGAPPILSALTWVGEWLERGGSHHHSLSAHFFKWHLLKNYVVFSLESASLSFFGCTFVLGSCWSDPKNHSPASASAEREKQNGEASPKSFTSVGERWEGKTKWWSDPNNHSPTSASAERAKQNGEASPKSFTLWGHFKMVKRTHNHSPSTLANAVRVSTKPQIESKVHSKVPSKQILESKPHSFSINVTWKSECCKGGEGHPPLQHSPT